MPQPFPHRYELALDWDGDRRSTLSAPPRPSIAGGPPPEFDGEPQWWSPEHLLLSSLSLCFQGTFHALAARADLRVIAYRSRAEGVLDKTPAGIIYTSITLHVDVRVPAADLARAPELLQKAKKHCITANSLKTEVTLVPSIAAG